MGEPGEILPARAFSDCSIFMGVRLATGCRCLLRSVSFNFDEDRIVVRLRFEGVNPQTLLVRASKRSYILLSRVFYPGSKRANNTQVHSRPAIHELRSCVRYGSRDLSARSTRSSRGLRESTTRGARPNDSWSRRCFRLLSRSATQRSLDDRSDRPFRVL